MMELAFTETGKTGGGSLYMLVGLLSCQPRGSQEKSRTEIINLGVIQSTDSITLVVGMEGCKSRC
jgi:hypothetical protein